MASHEPTVPIVSLRRERPLRQSSAHCVQRLLWTKLVCSSIAVSHSDLQEIADKTAELNLLTAGGLS
jgi:hypothetical protein